MELVDLNMIDNILKNKEFTIDEYIENTINSENDIEIQVDHINQEIKNYSRAKMLFYVIAIILTITFIISMFLTDISLQEVITTITSILLCLIAANLNNIILNKLYLIEMSNQILDLYYNKYKDESDDSIDQILAKY